VIIDFKGEEIALKQSLSRKSKLWLNNGSPLDLLDPISTSLSDEFKEKTGSIQPWKAGNMECSRNGLNY